MQEIKLHVEDENLDTVLNILNNLKSGLITQLQINNSTQHSSQYKPKLNTIIREENSGTSDRSGKYASAKAYKQKLKR